MKRSGAEQSNGSAGKAKLTADPGCSEMSGARAGVWSWPGRVWVGPRGESEGVGRSAGSAWEWAERVESGLWGRGEKGWAAQGFSWACLVWGLGWVEFG